MRLSRRDLMKGAGGLSLATGVTPVLSAARTEAGASTRINLPDRANYTFQGIHLNAAYTHPIGLRTTQAAQQYMKDRMDEPGRNWPRTNARDEAVALYAQIINAAPTDIAVVPSTLEGENLIAAALGLGPGAGVVTDSLHYDASLVLYGEMAQAGMPLTTLRPRDNRIDYDELERAITPETRLVALSHVSSPTGFRHDLKRVCEIAHAKGALVYADIIQSVGAIPVDVQDSGVDFCGAGLYKWLQGEFGAAFLYIRPDRLQGLKRTQLGWRGIASYQEHFLPTQPPGPAEGSWTLGISTAQIFEVSTINWGGLAATAGSLRYLLDIGIDRIAAYREPMLDRLQAELPRAGWLPLTPRESQGPAVVFAQEGAGPRYRTRMQQAGIYTTLQQDRIRISPSLHNTMEDVDAALRVLTT